MPKITFIEHNGTQHTVDAEVGKSVMQAAMDNLVPGIDADCGGECSCATCHVMVNTEWLAKTGGANEAENSMLDLNPERADNSRLSCQMMVSDDLDGLIVDLPEFQF
ncbi:MAG: 2Fe-2S iron-sulfur cluster binding domain-containing protein [Proteobacteria bacterium]|nr:2Fe-2S iron-sulfur cluster binding domain-containing protein [Pseudomonadota bacterium]